MTPTREQLEEENLIMKEKLQRISEKENFTLLGECCVEKTCMRHVDPPSYCTHQYGVNRGFAECASMAQVALQSIPHTDRLAKQREADLECINTSRAALITYALRSDVMIEAAINALIERDRVYKGEI